MTNSSQTGWLPKYNKVKKSQKKAQVSNWCVIDKGAGVFLYESRANGNNIKPAIAKTIKMIPKVLFENARNIA